MSAATTDNSPFIKGRALDRLLVRSPQSFQVITRDNLDDFTSCVSDSATLRRVLAAGGRGRGTRGLHAKLYLFGASRAVVTSTNLPGAALDSNHQFGAVTEDAAASRLWRPTCTAPASAAGPCESTGRLSNVATGPAR